MCGVWAVHITLNFVQLLMTMNQSSNPTLVPLLKRELRITYVFEVQIRFQALLISIVFDTPKRNKSLLMNLHCVLGIWEQRVPSKAMVGSSKRNEKTVSAQYSLHSSGANR